MDDLLLLDDRSDGDRALDRRLTEEITRLGSALPAATFDATAFTATLRRATRHRRRRQVLIRAAAIVTFVVIAGGVASLAARRASSTSVTLSPAPVPGPDATPTPPVALPPPAVLGPTWVPDGYRLWSLAVEQQERINPTQQLLSPDGGASNGNTSRSVLLRIVPAPGDPAIGDTPAVIRGRPATSRTRSAPGYPDLLELSWKESGAIVSAQVRGLTLAEAGAFLATMSFRSADPTAGMQPATPDQVLAESPGSTVPVTVSTFTYAAGEPTGTGPTLSVTSSSAQPAAGTPVPVLYAWFEDPAGTRAGEPLHDGGQVPTSLTRTWSDGRVLSVDAVGAPVERAALERLADESQVLEPARVQALRVEGDARTAARQPVATTSVTRADGRTLEVQLLGTATTPLAACVVAGAHPAVCGPARSLGSTGAAWVAGVLVDGTWYVLAGSQGEAPTVRTPRVETSTATSGGWSVMEAAVPAGVNEVQVVHSRRDGPTPVESGTVLSRPLA